MNQVTKNIIDQIKSTLKNEGYNCDVEYQPPRKGKSGLFKIRINENNGDKYEFWEVINDVINNVRIANGLDWGDKEDGDEDFVLKEWN